MRRLLKVAGDLRDTGMFADAGCANDRYVLFLERQGAKLWLHDSGVQFVARAFPPLARKASRA